MPYAATDFSAVRTYSLFDRPSLVQSAAFVDPSDPVPAGLDSAARIAIGEIAARIVAARSAGKSVIWSIGGHVVKRGLAPVVIELMERGAVTHLASNGAAAIHDFEMALAGFTAEDVASRIEDGSFGMVEETGALMNGAICRAAAEELGLGESLGRLISEDDRFTHRARSLLYNAYRLAVPYTIHVAIGTDIIHQHPSCDFAATGAASGLDFKIYTHSVESLEGGVFCNFGSAVVGPEVFLKALSVARNLGNTVSSFTAANFDLVPLSGDWRVPSSQDDPEYYYRPKKNIVIRPTSLGGTGYHVVGDHALTIPTLAAQIREAGRTFRLPRIRSGGP